MSLRVVLELDFNDYASLDDNVTHAMALTELEASIAMSILALLDTREVWEATDSEFDIVSDSVASLINEVQKAL